MSAAIRSNRVRGTSEVGRKRRSKHLDLMGSTVPTIWSIGTIASAARPRWLMRSYSRRRTPGPAASAMVLTSPSTGNRLRLAGRPRSQPTSLAKLARRRARSKSSRASWSANPVRMVKTLAPTRPDEHRRWQVQRSQRRSAKDLTHPTLIRADPASPRRQPRRAINVRAPEAHARSRHQRADSNSDSNAGTHRASPAHHGHPGSRRPGPPIGALVRTDKELINDQRLGPFCGFPESVGRPRWSAMRCRGTSICGTAEDAPGEPVTVCES